jgi:3-deoxy-D-manno-octulosonic-acid transferase
LRTEVYLADTMGEMTLWYGAAGITFVGGSLVRRGGHTPYEPAAAASAILHGPHVANFASAYARLDRDGGAELVTGVDDLADALIRLAGAAGAQAALADRATAALAAGAGLRGLDRFYAALFEATGLALGRPKAAASVQQSV